EGFFTVRSGLGAAIARGLAYAPYVDLLWCETAKPDLAEAREFAQAIHAQFPDKLLAYNCSPSFNWKRHLDDGVIAKFQRELAAGYFDAVTQTVTGGNSSITALTGSTEEQQFAAAPEPSGQRLGKRVS